MIRNYVMAMAFLGAMFGQVVSARAAEEIVAKVGEAAPAFSVADQNGKVHSLADYKGKVVVLEWTNPDCPFVVRHYREGTMKSLANNYRDQSVVWLAVNTTKTNTAEKSRRWTAEKELPYPTLIDADGKLGKVYGAKTTPHMFVIGKDGKLVYTGAVDDDPNGEKAKQEREQYLVNAITAALAGEAPARKVTKPYGCSVKYPE